MSGFAGIFHRDGRDVDQGDLVRLSDAIAKRGPDRQEIWREGPIGLAQSQLHTTFESTQERLPIISSCGDSILAADARIDNRAELISALRISKSDNTLSDGELIMHAYRKWGADCAGHLLGDFSFVIWNEKEKQLLCARDHMGVKPFYYYLDDEKFVFGSTVASILSLGIVPRDLNHSTIGYTLMRKVADRTSTFFKHIQRLPAAHVFHVSKSNQWTHRYWNLDFRRSVSYLNDDDYEEHFRELFYSSVSVRLRNPNGIVASSLSGGLDSSAVVSTASHVIRSNASSDVLKTYSCVFPGIDENVRHRIDESLYISEVLTRHGVQNRQIDGGYLDPVDEVDHALTYVAEPPYQFNLYLHRAMYDAASSDGARVFLDGIDGDTTISHGWTHLHDLANQGNWLEFVRLVSCWKDLAEVGRPNYLDETISQKYLIRQLYRGDVGLVNKAVSSMAESYGLRWIRVLDSKILRPILYSGFHRLKSKNETKGLRLDPELMREIIERGSREDADDIPHGTGIARYWHYKSLEAPLNQAVLEVADLTAKHSGLEPRYPFFDRRLIEFCLAIPSDQKFKNGWTRSILRRGLAPVLPHSTRKRMTKANLGYNLYARLIAEKPKVVSFLSQHLDVLQGVVDMESAWDTVRLFDRCTDTSSSHRAISDTYLLFAASKWIVQMHRLR